MFIQWQHILEKISDVFNDFLLFDRNITKKKKLYRYFSSIEWKIKWPFDCDSCLLNHLWGIVNVLEIVLVFFYSFSSCRHLFFFYWFINYIVEQSVLQIGAFFTIEAKHSNKTVCHLIARFCAFSAWINIDDDLDTSLSIVRFTHFIFKPFRIVETRSPLHLFE